MILHSVTGGAGDGFFWPASLGCLMRAPFVLALLALVLLAGCLDAPEQAGPEGEEAAPTDPPQEGAPTQAPPQPKEAAGVSGEFVLETHGTVSGSINRCQAGQDQVALPAGYPTVVAVLRWEPVESALRVSLDAEGGRDPQPQEEAGSGTLRATWTDLAPGTFTLRVDAASEVVAATQYHAHAVMVPAGVDPATVDPVAMASVPGGC